MLDIHRSTLNAWENGHFTPHVRFVPKIVAFLGYDPFGTPPSTFPLQLKAARIARERGEAHPIEASTKRLQALLKRSLK